MITSLSWTRLRPIPGVTNGLFLICLFFYMFINVPHALATPLNITLLMIRYVRSLFLASAPAFLLRPSFLLPQSGPASFRSWCRSCPGTCLHRHPECETASLPRWGPYFLVHLAPSWFTLCFDGACPALCSRGHFLRLTCFKVSLFCLHTWLMIWLDFKLLIYIFPKNIPSFFCKGKGRIVT